MDKRIIVTGANSGIGWHTRSVYDCAMAIWLRYVGVLDSAASRNHLLGRLPQTPREHFVIEKGAALCDLAIDPEFTRYARNPRARGEQHDRSRSLGG
jgi:hypothetical protein